jgi:hypothetical protein
MQFSIRNPRTFLAKGYTDPGINAADDVHILYYIYIRVHIMHIYVHRSDAFVAVILHFNCSSSNRTAPATL